VEEVRSETVAGPALEESEQGRRWGLSWLTWLIVALLLYVLSVGPVVKLCDVAGNRAVMNAVGVAYSPLEFAYYHSSAAKRFFNWYLGVWGIG
jgi:hypothetical protein